VHGGKCISKCEHLKKKERSQINNLTLKLKKMEKSKRNKIIKIKTEINKMKNRKSTEKSQ